GAVIKFQYDLPTNSTEYTSRIYGFANTVSRDMNGDTSDDVANDIDSDQDSDSRKLSETEITIDNEEERDNDTLVDITFDRRRRSLAYSEGGMIMTGNDDENTEVPLQEAIRRQEQIDENKKSDRILYISSDFFEAPLEVWSSDAEIDEVEYGPKS
ncbi:Uncharacterized protein OBRU01_15669, partial [Operophtera brumata]